HGDPSVLHSFPTRRSSDLWCPHCAEQKEMFESSFHYVPYVECGIPGSRDEAQVCKDVGIKHFPTWRFADGEKREGTQPLQVLGTDRKSTRLNSSHSQISYA